MKNDLSADETSRLLYDLLALIHGDGGEHTSSLGLKQSVYDARGRVLSERKELAETVRELREFRIRTGWTV